MIELERHIEILLLSNDCVIVPSLGGFMTHYIDARYEENDHTFLPPLRTLGFNPQLTMNDSLLVQSYIETYDISYPEAQRRIEDEVCELKQHLDNEGFYEFNGIGTLSLNEDGKYLFTPCEAGILTPDLYGLSSFEMIPLRAIIATAKAPVVTEEAPKVVLPVTPAGTIVPLGEEPADKEIPVFREEIVGEEGEETDSEEEEETDDNTIVIKMSWIRNTVAFAAALLAFILMTTPVSNSDVNTQYMSQFNSNILFGAPKDSNYDKITIRKDTIEPAPVQNKTIAVDAAAKEKAVEKTDTIPAVASVTGPTYYVVLASYVTKKNANDYVGRLHKQGFDNAQVFVRNNVTRVVLGGFESEGEAYNQKRSIQSRDEFKDTWVLKVQDES